MKRVIAFLLTLILAIFTFSGCKKQTTAGKSFVYPLSSSVRSLDPQIAGDTSAATVLEHAMEGLTRLDENGTPVAGMAKTWEISEDGLTYTFYLRNDALWYLTNSAKKLAGDQFDRRVTAQDFVFALQRAVDPNTNSPLFHTVSAVKNAQKIHDGSATAANLGVKALDDWTLRITLERPDSSFLKTTSTAIMYPCNKAFFELTKGRYALELQFFISNGPFSVYAWEDSKLSLTRYEDYHGEKEPVPSSVGFRVNTDTADIAAKVLDGTYAAASLSGAEATSLQGKDKIGLYPRQDIVWCFLINGKDESLMNRNIRRALYEAFQRDLTDLPSYISQAAGLVPSVGLVSGKEYRAAAGPVGIDKPNATKAQKDWQAGLAELKEDDLTLTISCMPEQEAMVKRLLQAVQGSLGLTLSLKIAVLSESELTSAVSAGNYQIAFAPLKADSNSVYDFLSQFSSAAGTNAVQYSSKDYDRALKQALSARTVEEAIANYKKAETLLLRSYCIYPVSFELSYYVTAPDVSRVLFQNIGGRVNFIYAERKE